MGCLESFDKLTRMIRKNHFDIFVETGCGKGDSLAYAATFPFKELYSVEIVDTLLLGARQRFASDHRVLVVHQESAVFLEELLPSLNRDQPILFYLDAHWPGLDFGIDFGKWAPAVALPLERELDAISRLRRGKDTVIIDDLKIYEDGPYPSPALRREDVPVFHESRSMQLADELFRETHIADRIYQDDGYLVLTPRGI